MRFLVRVDTGYAGVWEDYLIIADTKKQAEDFASDALDDFSAEYMGFCINPYDEDEVDMYYDNCMYSIEEVSEEEFKDKFSEEEWLDLRKEY